MIRSPRHVVALLKARGLADLPHGDRSYLGHAWSVGRLLYRHGHPELHLAGLVHSIYGTERSAIAISYADVERREVEKLVGERMERLAYLNCAMDREAFDAALAGGERKVWDRFLGKNVMLSGDDHRDLCLVHLFDWLEQVERMGAWEYRRDAYRLMAVKTGALEAYEMVQARRRV